MSGSGSGVAAMSNRVPVMGMAVMTGVRVAAAGAMCKLLRMTGLAASARGPGATGVVSGRRGAGTQSTPPCLSLGFCFGQ